MKAVILDAASLGDIDLRPLTCLLDDWQIYATTRAEQLIAHIGDADIILSNKVEINSAAMAACPQIKLISILATGTNNIDLDAAANQGIVVCNARGYGTASVVQHTLTLMLNLASNLPRYQQDVKNGLWQNSPTFTLLDHPISELSGKTLGIIGYGELGSHVGRIAEAFGMQVIIAARDAQDKRPGRLPREHLLQQADYVSLHCPLTPDTQELINSASLATMKPSAFLINTARGGLINAVDLVTALRDKVIAGAALDVLDREPAQANDPLIKALDLNNLIITPHNAWAAIESRRRLLVQSAENIEAFLKNGMPPRVVVPV